MKDDTLNGQLIIALSRSLQIIHKQSEMLFREYHLTYAQFTVLEALYHKGDLTIKTLIETVLSTSGNMTVVIRNLEKQGLIKKISHPEDKRSYIIQLTTDGLKLIQIVFKKHMTLVESSMVGLSHEDKKTIIELLKKLRGDK